MVHTSTQLTDFKEIKDINSYQRKDLQTFLILAVVITICWLRSAYFKISDYLFYLRNKASRIRAKCNWGRIAIYIIV